MLICNYERGDSMNELGNNIRLMRKKYGYSQINLASAVGVSQTSIVHYEKGTRQPSIETLISFSKLFDEPIDSLVGNKYRIRKPKKTNEVEKRSLVHGLVESLISKNEAKFNDLVDQSLILIHQKYTKKLERT